MRRITPTLAAMMITGGLASAASAIAAEDIVIVYDASGSMWGQIEGSSKIEIARDVMAELVDHWDTDTNLGLVAYGHRRQGDCRDIETLVEPGPIDKAHFIDTVNAIKPVGKTPISASVQHAADLLAYRDNPATVVLVSDGVETCNADPCALSEQLASQGVEFTAHVIGFDLEDEAHASLSCIAENTGGLFVPASNADELHAALAQVKDAVNKAPPAPEPAPEPEPPEVSVSGPDQVVTGAPFDVSWSSPINTSDMIAIVPVGADEGTRGNYKRTGNDTEGRLTAPADTGLYELRYILDEDKRTLATAPIEVIAPEISVSGPDQVVTGAPFEVSWSSPISTSDMIAIVPVGADEGTRGNYKRTGNDTEGRLTAPADTGLYELRYILDEGKRTLATASIEVVAPEMGISGPPIVRVEENVDISWSSTINSSDMIAIVPAGADEGVRGTYRRTGKVTKTRLSAPAETGLYEIRYILDEGKKTLASVSLEVVGADAPLDEGAGLSVPASAAPGETITISWSGGNDSSDQRISIARKEQPDFSWISVHSIGEASSMELIMPDDPGLYEVRFLDIAGRELLGRSVVEVK
ncbi:VWA domain-containing protein [Halomonas marinisediminis]|uniref:VWA domain-containing protein n=1 Tax=Halomonas marinisediminis TaxID=2546095 RepID=A0ABY2D849_9GAMM|nr:VWA domain-containing protein [Halomonas marinisediminis]TDB03242.1 VWA domain-containing protein [Halomonas marinisediminis]